MPDLSDCLRTAQGTEADTAETSGLGLKDDGPVAEGHAPRELPEEIERAIEEMQRWAILLGGLTAGAAFKVQDARSALTTAILDRLTAAEASRDAAIQERDEARAYAKEVGSALVGLTCDGSEFYQRGGPDWRVDPGACAAYVRRQRSDKHDSILRFAKRANEAEAERDAALARVERLEKALDFYRSAAVTSATMEGLFYQGVSNSMFRHAWEADRAALSAGEKA